MRGWSVYVRGQWEGVVVVGESYQSVCDVGGRKEEEGRKRKERGERKRRHTRAGERRTRATNNNTTTTTTRLRLPAGLCRGP